MPLLCRYNPGPEGDGDGAVVGIPFTAGARARFVRVDDVISSRGK